MKNLIACLVVCVLSGVVAAEVHHVPADFPTIQYAIDAAVDGDEIIVAPGTYTSTADEVVNMRGKEIWLHSSKGAQVTIIDGEGTRRGILCENGETLNTVIEGFTITNGYDYDDGGGMYNYGSSPTLTNCTFTGNTATFYGGGMSNYNSNPTLTNCTFDSNSSGTGGGGMYNESNSDCTLIDCIFIKNTTEEYWGGGMSNQNNSDCTLTNCDFIGNIAGVDGRGGGMYNDSNSDCTLTNCTFTSNTSNGGDGGGIFDGAGNSTLTNCTFTGNTAANGGGIRCTSSMIIYDCTFIQNNALASGGGISSNGNNSDDSPTISSSSFCENDPDAIYGNWNNGGDNDFLNDCGDVEGACCVKEACYEVEFLFCDAIGGEWLGYNETCEVDTCSTPPQYGACCINGEAIPLFDYDCIRILGAFMGEGTNPDDVTCPAVCAEDVTGDGLIDVSDLLAIIGVWGACP